MNGNRFKNIVFPFFRNDHNFAGERVNASRPIHLCLEFKSCFIDIK